MTTTGTTEFEYQPLSSYYRKFLIWAGASLIVLFLVLGTVQRVFESGLRQRMLVSHERGLDMAEQLFNIELLRAVQDVHLIAELKEVQKFLRSPNDNDARAVVENTFVTFAESYGYYDQIRLISMDGMEVVRINYDDSIANVVPASALLDKSNRNYVRQGNQLTAEEIYISPLELNADSGEVDVPHEPVIRIVERIDTGIPNENALLVLNYKANHLLNYFRSLFRSDERGMLLNAEGYWLSNHERENEWGWQTGRDDLTVANWMPDLWNRIDSNESGQYNTGELSFSYRRIEPAGVDGQTLDGRYSTDLGILPDIQNSNWYIVVQTDFASRMDGTFFRSWAGYIVITLLVAACLTQAFLVSRYRATRSHFIREMKDLYDNAPIGYLTLDKEGHVKRVNRALVDLVGYKKREMVGNMRLTDLLADPDAIDLEKLESGDQQLNCIKQRRLSLKDKEGNIIPSICSFTPRFNGSGALVLSRCSVQDFSEQAELEDALKEQARTDPLTGVYNRRYFWELATQELSRKGAESSPVSVLLLDIDHFKSINDTYGHTDGDTALVSLTHSCAEKLRKSDILARFGGEEFVVLLPGANLDEALQKAEEIRSHIASISVRLSNDAVLQMTVSIGVATMVERDIDELDDLLNLADTRLYQAKDAGRNRVCCE